MKNKIDEVAKECGLTKRTIRYYEEIGLLSPPERSEGGIRLYTAEDIERLKQIVNARDVLGFSLQEIQDFVQISENLEHHIQDYRKSGDDLLKQEKLAEMERVVVKQLEMVDSKLEKMSEFRKLIAERHLRIRNAITKPTSS